MLLSTLAQRLLMGRESPSYIEFIITGVYVPTLNVLATLSIDRLSLGLPPFLLSPAVGTEQFPLRSTRKAPGRLPKNASSAWTASNRATGLAYCVVSFVLGLPSPYDVAPSPPARLTAGCVGTMTQQQL